MWVNQKKSSRTAEGKTASNTSLLFLQNYFYLIFSIIIWLCRAVSTLVRNSGDNLSDTLKLLGHRNKEEGWKLFDDIIIQNAQNGLVSFELNEHLER